MIDYVPVRITEKIRSIIRRDNRVMIRTTRESYPFVAESGSGDYAYDAAGNRFIDFSSFIAVFNLGVNANQEVRNAIKKQADKLSHAAFTDYYSELPVSFAESLLKMFPKGFGRVFFSNSGTEANEAAIKFSRMFTGRQYNIAFYGAFHGRTRGSLSLTASKIAHRKGFGPFDQTVHVPFAYCYRCPLKQEYPSCGIACVDYIKDYPLSKEVSPDEIAALVMEPVQGEGGYIVPPADFVKRIRKLADDNGILLIDDEIQAGYMRTGKFLALDNFGVNADIYTMAKAVGGGMPLGVTVSKSALGNMPAGAHASTFGGNLVSIAAAEASLNYVKKNMKQLQSGILKKGAYAMKRLNEMKEKYEIIGDVRGLGMMIGVELVKSKKTKEPAVEEREKIIERCFSNNLLLLPAGVSTIRIIPPLTISDDNLEKGLDILEEAIKEAA
jgi:4-aminobutyrate aminotransferase